MDITRFLLAIGLSLGVLWVYQLWLETQYPQYYQQDQPPAEEQAPKDSEAGSPDSASKEAGSRGAKGAKQEPEGSVPQVEGDSGDGSRPDRARQTEPPQEGITVTTDVLRVTFGHRSGDPVRAEVLRHRRESEKGSGPVRVLKPEGQRIVMAQVGWLDRQGSAPSHRAQFQPVQEGPIELGSGNEKAEVSFVHEADGLTFRKTYRFRTGSHRIGVDYSVTNQGSEPWQGQVYGQLRERGSKPSRFFFGDLSYDGPVVFGKDAMHTPGHGGLLDREDQRLEVRDPDGWSGAMSRYFLSVWLPEPDAESVLFARASERDTYAGFTAAFPAVAPESTATQGHDLFLGPKEQALLESTGRNLRRAVDYGILSFLAVPLFQVLQFFHSLVGNYGIAIILVVVVIKLLFYPLFTMSYRAMAKMRKVQPELQRLREEYSDDRQRLNQEMMRLYREEKVNPLGGCLPILVQIPVFIALYWVLLESVELRHEPFMLWIQDLTSRDPLYILPVLMGGSMVIQQLMNPAPLDPVQKKVMLALPVVFTVFFIQFPAGLVLYWLTNNVLSIAQQWWIMRQIE